MTATKAKKCFNFGSQRAKMNKSSAVYGPCARTLRGIDPVIGRPPAAESASRLLHHLSSSTPLLTANNVEAQRISSPSELACIAFGIFLISRVIQASHNYNYGFIFSRIDFDTLQISYTP